MKVAYYTVLGVCGFIFGLYLADCTKAYPQAKQNERVTLTENNTVVLRTTIDGSSVQSTMLGIVRAVVKRGFKGYPIYLVLDSPGGDVMAGVQLIEFAKTITNLKTITIFSASMAADTVEGLPGDRLITDNGELMFHRARGEFAGQFEVGEVESRLASAKRIILKLETQNAKRMGIPVEEYKARSKDEYWLDATTAVQSKAADKIVDIVCTPELIDSKIVQTVDTIFGSYKVVYSGCPTFRMPLLVETLKEAI